MTKLIKSAKYENVFAYETKHGIKWMFRYQFTDCFGKRRDKQQRKFLSEEAAHKAELEAELQVANEDSTQLLSDGITVAEWTHRFLKMKQAEWRPNYRQNFNTAINRYIIPLLGNRKLSKLTKMDYSFLYIQPMLEKLKPSSAQMNHRLFMIIVNAAVDNEVIPRNKLKGFRFKKSEPRKPFSQHDLALFNHQLTQVSPDKRLFFQLLEMTGMRLGEGLGLEWRDISFKHKTVSIERARTPFGVGPTKTPSSVRTIYLEDNLLNEIHHFQVTAKANALKNGHKYSKDDFIFSFNHTSAYYYFCDIIKDAGIEEGKYVIHSLRHTHATLLISAGVSVVDVAKRLGHSDPSITLKTYSHYIQGNDKNTAEIFAKLVNFG